MISEDIGNANGTSCIRVGVTTVTQPTTVFVGMEYVGLSFHHAMTPLQARELAAALVRRANWAEAQSAQKVGV